MKKVAKALIMIGYTIAVIAVLTSEHEMKSVLWALVGFLLIETLYSNGN